MNIFYDLLFKRFREWDLQTINLLSKTCVRFESDVAINSVFKTGFIVEKKCYYLFFFHCFNVHFDSLSFIHTNSYTFSYNYVSVF